VEKGEHGKEWEFYQGANILVNFPRGQYMFNNKKKFPPRGKISNKRQAHTFNNL